MILTHGLPRRDIATAATLYWQAFGAKLGRTLGPDDKAETFIASVLRPDHAIAAHDDHGALLGIVGFKTAKGAFVAGSLSDLRAVYGPISGTTRGLLLSLLERDTENARFLMDGICVTPAARGQGVGTALLAAICDLARRRGYAEIRLDVVDTNARARALYARQGFAPTKTDHIGPLRLLFGFTSSTTMVKPL